LCLRGGTYTGKFKSSLNGGTVRSYPGEWAVIDGNQTATVVGAINSSQSNIVLASVTGISNGKFAIDGEMMQIDHITGNTVFVNRHWDGTAAVPHADGATVKIAGNQFEVAGDNTVYRDLEVTNSDTNRNDNGDANGFDTIIRGSGIVQYNNTGNSYINLIVHDNLNGFFIGSGSSNSLFYGCLSYNNGMYGDPSGHGYYLENSAGYSRVYESMALNNFNLGVQAYGVSGPYVGGDFQGSVFAGSGSPVGQYHYNMIYGPDSVQSPTATVNACHFYHAAGGPSYSISFGYGAGITTGVFTNNYIVGAGSQLMIGRLANATITGNKFYTALSGFKQTVVLPGGTAYNWNNNSYYGTGSFGIGGNMVGFAVWKAATGYDAAGTDTASALPDTVIVRPNAYQAGRANIIIYAGSRAASINVNLSTSGLVNGQAYTIKNAYNYLGANVATGVYNAAAPTISVPLNSSATAVATPTGQPSPPATACPQQCALIVVPN
ncbi:MAG TPA: hypothetical protein VHQ01_10585, partial [Pyrinomonadaceae bacterium]|nr:hypothetical protein [Pyrinomonadaceae bacterium]